MACVDLAATGTSVLAAVLMKASPWPGRFEQATVPSDLLDVPLARADVAAEKGAATVR